MDTPRRDEVTFTLTTPADVQPSSTVILRFPSRPRWNPLATRVGDSCGIAPAHLALAYADRHGRELVLRGDDDLRMAYAIAASMGEARQLRFAVLSTPRACMRRPADKPLPHLPFLSDTPRTSPARLFTCGICLEYGELSAVNIQGCRHRFCRCAFLSPSEWRGFDTSPQGLRTTLCACEAGRATLPNRVPALYHR